MASTVYYLMTICFVFATVHGASVNLDMKDINSFIPEKCKELLLDGSRNKQKTYCTEKPDFYPEDIQKEIEDRISEEDLLKLMPDYRPVIVPITPDDCSHVDDEQNCCTASGWEAPTYYDLNGRVVMIPQLPNLTQAVKIVRCANEGGECFNKLDFLDLMGYNANCRTDYGKQKLFVYTDKNDLAWDYVPIAVSCSCVISKKEETLQ